MTRKPSGWGGQVHEVNERLMLRHGLRPRTHVAGDRGPQRVRRSKSGVIDSNSTEALLTLRRGRIEAASGIVPVDRGALHEAAIAGSENRTPTNYVETLVLRDLEAKDETNRVLTVYAAPETAKLVPGELERTKGETNERYEQRKKLVDELLSIPDEG